ncbi:stage II sporulation protein M [Jidongwangia harbinensis]|uniref:stage II sporulation protein M n=1 Tax=Jidongwangia harbinensis TaxID=2878561 RepID=UPI001CD95C67|nr:stage II sporulation protein M [Jidongwangia harbinensis]MCA2218451.1 stage II sporulation protein M [Jidongwangia harbinensis]
MDLDAYVAEHRGEWNRLETLTRKRRLSPDEADELVLLYQRAATHLSLVRSRSPDPVLIAGLSRLVLAARAAITGGRRFSWQPVARFFTSALPGELYRARWWWIGVGVLCVVLGGALMRYVAANPDVAALFMSDEDIQQLVANDFVGYYSEFQAQNFAALVWTNNALLTAQCLASGVLIIPVLYLLGANLLSIGVTGGVMIGADAGDTFFTYIAPHGLLELTCVFVGAGVGLRIGWAWIAPGPHRTRGQALAERARSGMLVALGLALTLGVAGLLEAYVTPSSLPAVLRIAIGALVWLLFLGYALGVGGAAHRRRASADLTEQDGAAEVPMR